LSKAVSETHAGDPIPGWFQYDIDVEESFVEGSSGPSIVTRVGGFPLDLDRMYRVATKVSDLTNGQSPTLTDYYKSHPELLPPKGAYVNIYSELMSYFSRNLWRRIWDAAESEMMEQVSMADGEELCDDECFAEDRLEVLDKEHSGVISLQDIVIALRDIVGISVDESEDTLAQYVHSFADIDNDGKITVRDLELFCEEIPKIYERDKWRLAYRKEANAVL
jgi:Ca2+-binding EF-hand superfamily protein